MMISLRRLTALFCVYKYKVYSVIILGLTTTYFLLKWNVFCSNFQASRQAKRMCKSYEEKNAVGSLCAPVCLSNDIKSITCHTFGSTKEAVFSMEFYNTHLVFKSAATNVKSLHWFENGVIKYPSQKEFSSIIQALVRNKLNVTLSQEALLRLTHLTSSEKDENDVRKRRKEMDNIWVLVQNNEYLLSTIYSDKDIFPQLLGTCGPFFAVEYVDPLEDVSAILSVSDNRDNWVKRIRTSIQILDLLEELETGFREPFHLCDMKVEHFGLAKASNKLKFIDLDGVCSNAVIHKVLSEVPHCKADEDCDIYDCRSKCLNNKCANFVTNNNLQIVCEKIFLGWRVSNTIIIPGLLMSQYTPGELASILRLCANPENESGVARMAPEEDIRERLFNILTQIEESLNNDMFL